MRIALMRIRTVVPLFTKKQIRIRSSFLDFLGSKSHSPNGSMPFHEPKKVTIFRAQPPPTCPCNGSESARIKHITYGVV